MLRCKSTISNIRNSNIRNMLERSLLAIHPIFYRYFTVSRDYFMNPVPTPLSTNELDNNKINEGGSNQKLMLFSRGNAIS